MLATCRIYNVSYFPRGIMFTAIQGFDHASEDPFKNAQFIPIQTSSKLAGFMSRHSG